MKKILLGLTVCFATVLSAQNYAGSGWGNSNSNSASYNNYTDDYYFPDDYYYEYPEDYYADDYYRGFYDDYRQSMQMINWSRFFRDYRLNRQQIALILDLNNQFNSYHVWNSYYRTNPQRWYYDRYYALERILGPSIFVVFQNNYYNGYSPVIYYHNRWENYYRPTYYVRPAYVNINVNHYRVNRQKYHQSVGNNYGWKQTREVSNSFVEDGNRSGSYRSNATPTNGLNNTGTRNASMQTNTRSTTSASSNTIQPVRSRSASAETTNTVQSPRPTSVRSTQPVRSTQSTRNSASSNNRSVQAPRSSSTRSSVAPAVSSSQRSSSTGTRGGR